VTAFGKAVRGLRHRIPKWVTPEQIAALRAATASEGRRLAEKVWLGECSRADVEAALAKYGDGECVEALAWLDDKKAEAAFKARK
jgi:hypothetical protein